MTAARPMRMQSTVLTGRLVSPSHAPMEANITAPVPTIT